MARGNSTSTAYGYDGADRLTSLAQTLAGTNSVTFGASYSAVSQILSRTSTNEAYTSHPANTATSYVANGLNQYTSVGAPTFAYDTKGNLTSDGTRTFTYDVENRLLTETGGPQNLTLSYDPLGRLQQTVGSATTQFLYAGGALVAEYSGSTVLRRYVQGADADEPVIWYEGSGVGDRRWLQADNQGSIIAYTDGTGTAQALYGYGAYGEPNAWSGSRYRYTGQIAIPEAALYYYKARVYDPTFGRFLQTDPIGYASDVNAYAYVGNDPFNENDPSGKQGVDGGGMKCPDICLTVYGAPQIPIEGICGLSGCSDIMEVLNRNLIGFNGLNGVNFANQARNQPAARPQNTQKPSCSSVLPNGQTIGPVVQNSIANIEGAAGPYDVGGVGELGAFVATVQSNGPIDFKKQILEESGSPAFLGSCWQFCLWSHRIGHWSFAIGRGVWGRCLCG